VQLFPGTLNGIRPVHNKKIGFPVVHRRITAPETKYLFQDPGGAPDGPDRQPERREFYSGSLCNSVTDR